MNQSDKERLRDLLRRAENAQQAANLPMGKGAPVANDTAPPKPVVVKEGEPSVTENIATIADGMRKTGKKLNDIKEAAGGFWDRAKPVVDFVAAPIKWVAGAWGWMWNKFAYKTDKETGERNISRSRAGAILSATFLAAVAMTPTLAGEEIRAWTVDPLIDAPVMLLTRETQPVFNVKSQEIAPDVYRLQGCLKQPCNPSNTVTFNIESRVSHGIWKMLDKQTINPMFVPDLMAATVPPGQNVCTITSYSARFRAAKYLQIFPQVLDISCVSAAGGAPTTPQGTWEIAPPVPAPVAP